MDYLLFFIGLALIIFAAFVGLRVVLKDDRLKSNLVWATLSFGFLIVIVGYFGDRIKSIEISPGKTAIVLNAVNEKVKNEILNESTSVPSNAATTIPGLSGAKNEEGFPNEFNKNVNKELVSILPKSFLPVFGEDLAVGNPILVENGNIVKINSFDVPPFALTSINMQSFDLRFKDSMIKFDPIVLEEADSNDIERNIVPWIEDDVNAGKKVFIVVALIKGNILITNPDSSAIESQNKVIAVRIKRLTFLKY